jgi:Insertion element 4 transposase N-terminal
VKRENWGRWHKNATPEIKRGCNVFGLFAMKDQNHATTPFDFALERLLRATEESFFNERVLNEVLKQAGTQNQRKPRLKNSHLLLLLVAINLFRRESIVDVAMMMGLARVGKNGQPLSSANITAARHRVGEDSPRLLFERHAMVYAQRHAFRRENRWRGFALFGVDSTLERTYSPV